MRRGTLAVMAMLVWIGCAVESGSESIVDHGYVPSTFQCTIGSSIGEGCICREIWFGGPRSCVGSDEAFVCDSDDDQCCDSTECSEGVCSRTAGYDSFCCSAEECPNGTCNFVLGPIGFCFVDGPPRDGTQRCVIDACNSDMDCPNGFCTTWGATRTCMPGTCRTNADCTKHSGGVCEIVGLGCCDNGVTSVYRPGQTTCVYPGTGCTQDADCPVDTHCGIHNGQAACRPGVCTANDPI